jgi:small-conductance mechanosensitive channel
VRRLEISLGIDQQASVARARDVILAALADMDEVQRGPPPRVFFEEVGAFTNNLHVLVWTKPSKRLAVCETRSAVVERLYEQLARGFPGRRGELMADQGQRVARGAVHNGGDLD